MILTGRYACHWRDYVQVTPATGPTAIFRYLLIDTDQHQAPVPTMHKPAILSTAFMVDVLSGPGGRGSP